MNEYQELEYNPGINVKVAVRYLENVLELYDKHILEDKHIVEVSKQVLKMLRE